LLLNTIESKKTKFLIKIFFVFFLIVPFYSSCSEGKTSYIHQEKPIWENKRDIIFKKLITLGTDDIDKSDYFFGHITDISLDNNNNIYVLDYRNYKASKFTNKGEFIRSYGNGKGQGPGEFQFPVDICSDSHGNVYISDMKLRRINVFDSKGKFITSFKTEKIAPLYDMITYKDSILFVGVDPRNITSKNWKGGIFQMYSLPEGKLSGSIGKSWIDENTKTHIGSNSISINRSNNNIIVSYSLPYLIEMYSEDLSLLKSFGRKDSFFGEIIYNRFKTAISSGSSLRMVCLPDGKIINVIRHIIKSSGNEREIRLDLDFFDENGVYLMTISANKLGAKETSDLTEIVSDSEGNIWISFEEPYPHVSKFKIEFVDK
jgi:hypothetical protein